MGKGTHSSILAWEITWTEEPGGLQSIEWQRLSQLSDQTTENLRQNLKTTLNILGVLEWGILLKGYPCMGNRTCLDASVQFRGSVTSDFTTPWTAAHQASLSFTSSRSLLKLMSIESVMPSNHLILCHPLLLLPSIFPSIRVFSNESVHIRWPKYQNFSFNISPSKEHSGLISFRMD